MNKNKSKSASVYIILGAIVIAVVLIIIGGRSGGNGFVPQGGHSGNINRQFNGPILSPGELEDDDAVIGDKDAPVTLVEFGDYQCTFCTKFFKETESALIEKYVKTGKLKIVFRDLVINGRESQNAAEAAQCAGEQGRYWQYHDKLFTERRGYNVGVFVKDNLKKFAGDLGLNEEQFSRCYDSGKFRPEIADDGRDASRFGARGTPNFFLNGRQLVGAQPLNVFESLIDQELNQELN